jgi:hypothetical protein
VRAIGEAGRISMTHILWAIAAKNNSKWLTGNGKAINGNSKFSNSSVINYSERLEPPANGIAG